MTRPRAAAHLFSLATAAALVLGQAAPAAAGVLAARPEEAAAATPPGAPPIALSDHVVQSASAYRAYMRRAAGVTAGFTSGPSIETALARADQSEPQQLASGAVAYAALIALQDPNFVAGVRTYAGDPGTRAEIARRLVASPDYAALLPGAASAAALVIANMNADGARVAGAGFLVKQSAYDIQHSKWSLAVVPDRDGRLSRAKGAAASTMSSEQAEVAELKLAVPGVDPSGAAHLQPVASLQPATPPYAPTVARGLAVAAMAALGEAGDDNDAQVQTIMNDPAGGFCLNMSKLNLYQCLAVAKPYYEDVFCLGQHVLIDTGQCISKGVGGTPPEASLVQADLQAPVVAKPAALSKTSASGSRVVGASHRAATAGGH